MKHLSVEETESTTADPDAATRRGSNGYTAFGLSIDSEIECPELAEQMPRGEPDVVVRIDSLSPPTVRTDRAVVQSKADEYHLLLDVGTICIRRGREIVVDPEPGVPEEILRHVLLGPVLNHLLHQRGIHVIHASTISIDGIGVAFMGESGAGKTTTAMAFLREGYDVLSDDVAAIETGGDQPLVRHGYPAIKLEPAIVDRFDPPVSEPVGICAHRDRHFHAINGPFPPSTVPIRRMFVLDDAERMRITPIPPSDQVMALVSNTYANSLFDAPEPATANLHRCASLAGTVGVKRLERPRRFDALADVVDLVLDDLAGRS